MTSVNGLILPSCDMLQTWSGLFASGLENWASTLSRMKRPLQIKIPFIVLCIIYNSLRTL